MRIRMNRSVRVQPFLYFIHTIYPHTVTDVSFNQVINDTISFIYKKWQGHQSFKLLGSVLHKDFHNLSCILQSSHPQFGDLMRKKSQMIERVFFYKTAHFYKFLNFVFYEKRMQSRSSIFNIMDESIIKVRATRMNF